MRTQEDLEEILEYVQTGFAREYYNCMNGLDHSYSKMLWYEGQIMVLSYALGFSPFEDITQHDAKTYPHETPVVDLTLTGEAFLGVRVAP